MQIYSLNQKAYDKINKVRKNYIEEVNNALREKGLDGMVVRVKDGVKGQLLLAFDHELILNYELRFYPVTKSGEISKKANGWVSIVDDIESQFTPYKGAE